MSAKKKMSINTFEDLKLILHMQTLAGQKMYERLTVQE